MQVSVEPKEGLEREMTVEFPTADIDGEVKTCLQSLTKTVKINGFRPGKIPVSVVKKRFGAQVEAEVLNEKLQKSYFEAIAQEKINPAGQPKIDLVDEDNKDIIRYKATFEVYPEIEVASLSEQTFEKANVEITDADIDATIENIRKQNQVFNKVDRAAEEGDQVVVDFVGTIDDEGFNGNEGKDVPIILGQAQMIEGFEEGLKGAKAGDEITLNLKFPEDYHYADVAGKDVQFDVKVKAVNESSLPELNDEFFAKFGITEGGEEAFCEEVKKNMQLELDKAISGKLKNQIMDTILEVHDITVPSALVQEEAVNMAKQMQGSDEADLPTHLFEDQAKKWVALGLVLAEIVKANEIKANPEKVRQKVAELAATYENPQEVINYYMSNKDKLAEIESFVLEEMVVDWACDQAKVEEKSLSFTEFMNPEKDKEADAAE